MPTEPCTLAFHCEECLVRVSAIFRGTEQAHFPEFESQVPRSWVNVPLGTLKNPTLAKEYMDYKINHLPPSLNTQLKQVRNWKQFLPSSTGDIRDKKVREGNGFSFPSVFESPLISPMFLSREV